MVSVRTQRLFASELVIARDVAPFKYRSYMHLEETSDRAAHIWSSAGPNMVVQSENLEFARTLPSESFQMIYLDPPFNTGKIQTRQTMKNYRSETGSRIGFKGQTYETVKGIAYQYNDDFADYWSFLEPRLEEAWRLLRQDGTLYLHLDYREVHYAKVLLDALFGRESFLNEIIWAYDYGARSKTKWPAKHDNILVYVKDPGRYYFDALSVDREPYMAPGLVTPEKAALGKLPTDTWWHTIVSPNGKEKTGYPTQKPLGILRRMVQASSAQDEWILDFFAGSGTTGVAADQLGRRFLLVDENPEAIEVMRKRFSDSVLQEPPSFVQIRATGAVAS
jgi:site-specific DNA-methyltransferase (adenine-specific)